MFDFIVSRRTIRFSTACPRLPPCDAAGVAVMDTYHAIGKLACATPHRQRLYRYDHDMAYRHCDIGHRPYSKRPEAPDYAGRQQAGIRLPTYQPHHQETMPATCKSAAGKTSMPAKIMMQAANRPRPPRLHHAVQSSIMCETGLAPERICWNRSRHYARTVHSLRPPHSIRHRKRNVKPVSTTIP